MNRGFVVETTYFPDRLRMHDYFGIDPSLRGPFVALVEGYVIVGHVPPDDILSLLRKRPTARGLAVPGMPGSSPGMEQYGFDKNPYQVILIGTDGTKQVYSQH